MNTSVAAPLTKMRNLNEGQPRRAAPTIAPLEIPLLRQSFPAADPRVLTSYRPLLAIQ